IGALLKAQQRTVFSAGLYNPDQDQRPRGEPNRVTVSVEAERSTLFGQAQDAGPWRRLFPPVTLEGTETNEKACFVASCAHPFDDGAFLGRLVPGALLRRQKGFGF